MFADIVERFSDLSQDESLVQFFAAALERRDQLNDYEATLYGGTEPLLELIVPPLGTR